MNIFIHGRFQHRLFAALALLALPLAAGAQQIDYARSEITVASRQMNVPTEARFKKFTVQIALDPATRGPVKAQVEIDAASFDIGSDDFNVEALDRDWLDAKKFPKALFVSTSVRPLGGGRFEARGPLSIKGKTQDVVAPFTIKADAAGNAVIEGMFNIRRLQYGIGEGVWRHVDVVADEVQIRFRLHTSGKPPAKT